MSKTARLALLLCHAAAITGPYYLAYDCPDNCCDRVPECANLPGQTDHTLTYEDALTCIQAVEPACGIDVHMSFVAAGLDIFYYQTLATASKTGSALIAIDFSDIFKALPTLQMDQIGDIYLDWAADPDAARCNLVDVCAPWGKDNYSLNCFTPSRMKLNIGVDRMLGSWFVASNRVGFISRYMNEEYSHLLAYLHGTYQNKQEVCQAYMQDSTGSGLHAVVSGVIKHAHPDQLPEPDQTRLGYNPTTYQPVITTTTSTTQAPQ
ncbi:hypothetical protein GNI_050020 [Gregarina niphandrodes]|uniref:Transmembrane protein n=1 Tax=Gregarina niphandrodes TaxID=110365 RepID=A0A023B9H3_GRENI|nr:hypothetical protein GNI_050020 [Gregarina niphandrodes]EZG72952.1 hypothetical protein GNI_050020 [Gregarina niphandrodes]|eukprot:XP_011129711.1 hypothetical protein GNI_050020 [Gregarina niphandrodes]